MWVTATQLGQSGSPAGGNVRGNLLLWSFLISHPPHTPQPWITGRTQSNLYFVILLVKSLDYLAIWAHETPLQRRHWTSLTSDSVQPPVFHGQFLRVEKCWLPIKLLTALNADGSAFQIRRHPQISTREESELMLRAAEPGSTALAGTQLTPQAGCRDTQRCHRVPLSHPWAPRMYLQGSDFPVLTANLPILLQSLLWVSSSQCERTSSSPRLTLNWGYTEELSTNLFAGCSPWLFLEQQE